MNKILAAFGGAMLATLGAVSAQAAVIDFGAIATPGTTLSYTGTRLDLATAFSFGTAALVINNIGSGDDSGLALGDTVTLTPTSFTFDPTFSGFDKTWGAFTETLDTVTSINRGTRNAITIDFSGYIDGPGFDHTLAFMTLTANQVGGPTRSITASFTNFAELIAIPEPSTWAMLALGFVCLGFVGYHSRSRSRSRVSVID